MNQKTPISEREADFHNEVMSVALEKYPVSLLDEFIAYWTEPNKSNTKMRFEAQKFFHIGRRLGTWARNNKKWNSARGIKVNEAQEIATEFLKERYGIN
ncbi:MAG TPA: hypothetical protein VFM69_15770 [Pricia sp.]|nr:hypothetical protein [Pricia sp.]